MPGMRFLHTADWQLGMTRHFLDADAQARFTGARLAAVRSIGQLAAAEGCAIVVVCGDVFETNHVERPVVVRALDAMAAQPDVTFHLLPGNHDPLDPASVYRSPTFIDHQPANVVVLDSHEPVPVGDGEQIVAAPWLTKRPIHDLVGAAISDLPSDGTVRVVVGHGIVDALSPDPLDPSLIHRSVLEAAIEDGRVAYVALGDRHSTTDVGATGRIWYSGAPEPTDYVEDDPGNVLVVTIDASGVDVTPRRVGTWRFVRHDAELTGAEDVEALAAWLAALEDKERSIVKLALVGTLSLRDKAALDAVLAHHDDLLAALETWERRSDLVVLPDDDDVASLEVAGYAAEAAADLRAVANGDGDDALVARDALALLYRLVGSSR